MSVDEMTAFETQLARTFVALASRAPVEVDAVGLARVIATKERHTVDAFGRSFARPRWLTPVLIALLLLAAVVAAAYVGSFLLRAQLRADDLELSPRRTYTGVLRDVGAFKPAPDALLALRDGTVFASRPSDNEPNFFQLLDVDTGEITDIGRGLERRYNPGLAELPDGRILLIAANYDPPIDGASGPSANVTSEIFNPATGLSEIAPPMADNTFWPTVVRLHDGRVLILGGSIPPDGQTPVATAQIFDPATNDFRATGSMAEPRLFPEAALLPDGRVLVVGTATGDMAAAQTAEVYDPAAGAFTTIAGPIFAGYANVAALGGGQVLLTHGGCGEIHTTTSDGLSESGHPIKAEIFDWRTSQYTAAPDIPHCVSNLIGLPDGRAFVSGYYYQRASPQSQDVRFTWSGIYDPRDGSIATMPGPSGYLPQAIGLPDGRVVIYPGSYGWGGILE